MANLILRQLLSADNDKANMNIAPIIKPDPEERRSDEMDNSLEDTPPIGLEFLWSCCGKCSAIGPSPLLSPTTTVTANCTVVTGSTGSSFYSDDRSGSASWLTNSVQSSLSWWWPAVLQYNKNFAPLETIDTFTFSTILFITTSCRKTL